MFTNEEKKLFMDCTEKEQQEIFKAFLEGNVEYWERPSILEDGEWVKADVILNIHRVYRVAQPKEEGATPIKGIPWEVIDSKWNWAAMDMDGSISLFVEKPYRAPVLWCCSEALENDDYHYINGYFKLDIEDVYWTTSLTKRPEYC